MDQRAFALQPQELRSAFAFPGVGVKPSGREGGFFERYASVMSPYLEAAGLQADADFPRAVADDRAASAWSELQHQLFAYAFNVAVAEVYLHRGLRPSFLAGHSLGLYSALTVGRVLPFRQGLSLVVEAYRLACAACPARDGGLAVVVGLEARDIDRLIRQQSRDSLCRVNANNELTHVVAGQQAEVARVVAVAREAGALRTCPTTIQRCWPPSPLNSGRSCTNSIGLRQLRPSCPPSTANCAPMVRSSWSSLRAILRRRSTGKA